MLGMIRDALQEISKAQNEQDVVINVVINEDKWQRRNRSRQQI